MLHKELNNFTAYENHLNMNKQEDLVVPPHY